MLTSVKAKPVFVSAIGLLFLCALASYLSVRDFRASERSVAHTQDVRVMTGEVDSAISNAARERMTYMLTGNPDSLARFHEGSSQIVGRIGTLKAMVADNAQQAGNVNELDEAVESRLRVWEDSISRKQAGQKIDPVQVMAQNFDLARRCADASAQIQAEESRLLEGREETAHQRFLLTSVVVVGSFAVAMLLLLFYNRLLHGELRLRHDAERAANDAYAREAALRAEEERFRLFIEAVQDYAIFTLDAQGRVSSWNEGAARLKEYQAAEIIGRHFSCFLPAEDVEGGKPQQELETASREGRFEDEGWRVRKDGSRFWANVVITAIRSSAGEVIGFVKVTRDFTERMKAQEELRHANVELLKEITERKLAETRLASSERSLRELSRHLLRSQDEERRRIGRDLHDSLGQSLAVLKMNLDSLQMTMQARRDGAGQMLEPCVLLAEEALREVRTISYLLYPPMLEEMGLKSAIPWYLDGFSKRSGIHTTLEVAPDFDRLAPEVELAFFRILQEALTNVHRHSGSQTAKIKLSVNEGWALMEVRDEGKGIPTNLLEQSGEDWMGSLGVGLRGMNERMRQLGGKLEVLSTERGTMVTATVPAEAIRAKLERTA
jgi:PAS domain S-box-containing protein